MSFDPFSAEGKNWLDSNSEDDEFGAVENLGRGRTRTHSSQRARKARKAKKAKSYVTSGTDKKGDYVSFGGRKSRKRSGSGKRRKSRKRKKTKRRKRRKRRKSRKRRKN